MTNEERAVIDAARALIHGVGRVQELRDAVQALDGQPATERKFLVSYIYIDAAGGHGHGTAFATTKGLVTQECVMDWESQMRENRRLTSCGITNVVSLES